MTMTTDRSIPGRVYLRFAGGSSGTILRNPLWTGRLDPDGNPVSDGTGINVSAIGTISPEEARELAALLIEEADAVEAGIGPVTHMVPDPPILGAKSEQAEDERWKRAGQESRERFGRDTP